MNVNIDSSRVFLNKVLFISGLLFFLTPMILYAYFSFGESKFVFNKRYFAIVVDEGNESFTPLRVIKSPLTDSENIKSWLNVGMIEIFSTDANNYQSKRRWESVENRFSSSLARDFWDKEIERYENLLDETYQLSYAVISQQPLLVGEATAPDGTRMWKYYLEVTTENHSINASVPLYKKMKMIVVVKEINPKSNYKGIAITSIDIK